MTRRGRFGRRPRPTGNLTALVASLYQQQRAAEDRAMFDAYENGGLVGGRPVDDVRMRAYLAMRRDEMGQGDPLWDQWNNRVIQLDFEIGEEKIQLAFQQGNVGASAVAAFYRSQLKGLPKDSAFYREVAGKAAQWAKAVGSGARAAARSRATSALASKADAAARTWANYNALETIIRNAAVRAGILFGNQELTDANATRLRDFLAAGIPGPNGMITFEDWRQASLDAYQAFDTQIAINRQLNRGTKDLLADKEKFLNQVLVRVNAIDDRALYEAAREVFESAVTEAQGDPNAILDAARSYAATLTGIRDNAMQPGGSSVNDPEFIGGLQNEINALLTGKSTGATVADLLSNEGEGVVTNDADETAAGIAGATFASKALADGSAYYGQAEFGGPLAVVPYPVGAALDPFGRKGLGPDTQQAVLNINGKPTAAMLKGQPITAVGLERADGGPVDSVTFPDGRTVPVGSLTASQVAALVASGAYRLREDAQVVGYVFTQGGKTTYGIVMPDGSIRYSLSNPFQGAFDDATSNAFTLFVGTSYDQNTAKTYAAPPAIYSTVATADDLYVDPDVSPGSLRNLAANTDDEATASQYVALAEKRQRGINAETAYMERDRKGLRPPEAPLGFVGDALGNVQEALRRAVLIPELDELGDLNGPPELSRKNAGGGPLLPPSSPPPLGGAPGAYRPPAPTLGSPSLPPGKLKDDTYQPPPPPKGSPSLPPGKAKDDQYKPPPPKGGGQGGGSKVL